MRVLVTGGAGYIGSHAVKALLAHGHAPVVLDNLCRGHRAALPYGVPFFHADLRDAHALGELFAQEPIDCIMHFAGLTYVGESVAQPLEYHDVNTVGSIRLLRAAADAGVKRFIFSSTCATYGEPAVLPITEETPQNPINPYGNSKLMTERVLADHAHADPAFAYAALRYFNVAGAAGDGSLGEHHEPETHLIPLLLQVALGRRDAVTLFGEDYPTPDGTCVRDYVHVDDLVHAHLLAMNALRDGDARRYNVAIGRGYSVREVLDAARQVTGHPIPVRAGPRRPGDPATLFADARRIRAELGWEPRHTTLHSMIESAWRWFRDHPRGYAD